MGAVLIVDDQEDLRFSLSKIVKKEGHNVSTASTGKEAIELLNRTIVDLVFLDIGLPDINGIELIPKIKELTSTTDIIMVTGINEAKSAVDSLRAGAIDYLVKPFDKLEFTTILNRTLQTRLMRKEASLEKKEVTIENIIGSSPPMLRVKKAIGKAAEVESPVLVTGETGTGKELIARAIHNSRPSQKGVFVKVDCGTLSENLIEAELFGYEQGAFTDAKKTKKGLVEIANGGTLFLDEIGNLPPNLQPKLLRLIEESTFRRVGGNQDIQVVIRIVAATNVDINQQIAEKKFRDDLYYRLSVIPITLPALRERGNDVISIAEYYLSELQIELKKDILGFTPEATKKMLQHHWRGNIRELRNIIEREVIFNDNGWINLTDISPQNHSPEYTQLLTLKEMEQRYVRKILNFTNNNKSKAARILNISRTTLRDKL